ncbi:hypothetical protein SH661x_002231 [Planctomicrobium sp. SH661]|uniref:hypothetical protein n=1 Tax=Planctomicrobium sp. SH661 TaxID=3448124 RepID=UPI003F5BC87A
MLSLNRSLWDLVGSWWNSDRVRISPTIREIWKLAPGDVITIEECDWTVIQQRVQVDGDSEKILICQSGSAQARLTIRCDRTQRDVLLLWSVNRQVERLFIADVQIWKGVETMADERSLAP